MPNRILRASLRQSLRWNQCTPLAQSFYIRILTLVDDYGRYEAHHQLLANECFPYGDSQGNPVSRAAIESLLQIICNANLVVCYNIDGNQYLQLTRWKEHVRTQSKFPECPKELLLCKCTANAQQMITSPPSPSPSLSPSYMGVAPQTPDKKDDVTEKEKVKIPPDPLDALNYGFEIGLSEDDVNAFMDHHQQSDWRLKTGKMKDWKAAMRTWKRNGKIYGRNLKQSVNARNLAMGITPDKEKALGALAVAHLAKKAASNGQPTLKGIS